jgi:hypothetical protein
MRLALLCKRKGFTGVIFDNEAYSYTYFTYPENVKYKDKT